MFTPSQPYTKFKVANHQFCIIIYLSESNDSLFLPDHPCRKHLHQSQIRTRLHDTHNSELRSQRVTRETAWYDKNTDMIFALSVSSLLYPWHAFHAFLKTLIKQRFPTYETKYLWQYFIKKHSMQALWLCLYTNR